MIASAPVAFPKWGISSDIVVAHVMGEFGEETGGCCRCSRRISIMSRRSRWPINRGASQAYNGRMGNRVGTDDGWERRGQGLSQLTGLEEYIAFARKTGIDVVNHPELLIDPAFALECGIADFVMCGCVPFALRDSVLGVASMLNLGHLTSNTHQINGYQMRVNGTAL
jgi:putative chitinase